MSPAKPAILISRLLPEQAVEMARAKADVDYFAHDRPMPRAELLARLSPERVARDIPARLVLVHGVDDPAVPYTESLRLAAARPQRTQLVLVHVLQHVEPGERVRVLRGAKGARIERA